ncbi:MAG: methyltransferase domain-containing protein [Alphaproteobacteria bacterium]|nr:methyltransferase domain-containing protein [Alphaproteobacteria bacterium]
MSQGSNITDHYTSGELLERLNAALRDDGADPSNPTIEALAPYDQFHGRGLDSTQELAAGLNVEGDNHLLDVGSGIGGPARYLSSRFGCKVTGIDLTPEFSDVARHLTQAMGLDGQVAFEQGNALAMPFADGQFDGAYSMNVSMNIEDKEGFYREIFRVLKPGGWLVLSEVSQGPGGAITYPSPWARTADSSFLATPGETREGLEACGFVVTGFRDNIAESKAYAAKVRDLVDRGEKPPHRAVSLIHGDIGDQAAKNMAEGSRNRCVIPIEVVCSKPV